MNTNIRFDSVTTYRDTHRTLFDMIFKDEEAFCRIVTTLFNVIPETAHELINRPRARPTGDETLLMWAVWQLKPKAVKSLIDAKADPKFMNDMGQGVSTYWDENRIRKDEDAACEIAKMLYAAGTDLLKSYGGSWSVVRLAREYSLAGLRATLEELDPVYKTYEFVD